MRTNIEIDDDLMTKPLELGGLPTKKAVVEEALKMFIEAYSEVAAIKDMAGLGWEGDLDAIRSGRL